MAVYTLSFWLPFLLLLPFLLALFLLSQKNNGGTKPKFPPSPPKLPFIGNLHRLGEFSHRSLWKLSKKYGPIMLLQLGRAPTLVISSAKMAREVLKTHDLDFCSRPAFVGPKRLSYNFLDVAFGPYSEYWREMRKICVLELFSLKRVQSFGSVRAEEVALMINSISQSLSSPVNLTEKLLSVTDHIICRVAFGQSYEGRGFDNGRFQDVLYEAADMLGSFSAADFFPYIGWIIDVLTGFHARLEKSFHDLDAFYQQVIDEHRDPNRRPKPEQEDLVDVLQGLERKQCGSIRITEHHIKAVLMNTFLAGVFTSAGTMVWAMAELARNPRVMKKVQDEVRRCVGNKGKVEEADLDKLQYFKMVLKETFRLYPAGPLLIPRESLNHCKINGYDVYPKTRVYVNAWGIGRDPESWENPEEFFPERFMDSSIDFKGQHFELLPFGSGRRSCPGMNAAMATMELALANLLYCFNWELPSGMKKEDINMDESVGISIHKKSALYLVPINYN